MTRRKRRQEGFTIVELVISICVIAVLAAVAIKEMRDYTRRTKVSETMMATGTCKNAVSEGFLFLEEAPAAGDWGCEGVGRTVYAGAVETSDNGVIRVAIRGVDPLVNGRHIHLVPTRGGIPLDAEDIGTPVRGWICGSDWAPLRNALPGSCRADTTTYSTQDFE